MEIRRPLSLVLTSLHVKSSTPLPDRTSFRSLNKHALPHLRPFAHAAPTPWRSLCTSLPLCFVAPDAMSVSLEVASFRGSFPVWARQSPSILLCNVLFNSKTAVTTVNVNCLLLFWLLC